MKPAAFNYHAPTTVDEALGLLAEHAGEAKILAGGQSLGPLLNLRLAAPAVVIDLNRVTSLAYGETEDGVLTIGAMWRHRDLERSSLVAAGWPLLTEAIRWVAHPTIRNRGTLGGTVAHADPAAEIPAAMLALRAQMVVVGSADVRIVEAEDFFVTYLTSALEPDELLVEIRVPAQSPGTGAAWVEFAPRHGDYAIVGVAAVVTADPQDRVTDLRVALSGVAETPVVLPAGLADALAGATLGTRGQWVAELAETAGRVLEPSGDLLAGTAYKKRLIAHLVAQAVELACRRVGEH